MKRKPSHNPEIASDRIFIGVAGGSAAGKTTLCETINRQMAFDRNFKVETISLDSFYRSIDKTEIDVAEYNFDHPLSLDFDLAYDVLQKLKHSDEPVEIPQYSFVLHQRLAEAQLIYPANVILFEGLMAFHDERIRNMMTYKIFINCDDDIRLCRRIKRDTTERGRTIEGVLMQYNKFVKNSFRDFIYPTINYADLVIPGSRNNRISVDFIVEHIKNVAKKKNIFKTAQDTKVFLFGENEYFDANAHKNYKDSIEMHRESFLVFPTSDEHRRELDFFLNSLMATSFTQEYFDEVYIYQFIKTIRSLLRQLFELKNILADQIELISIHEIREKFEKGSDKSIKLIFLPIIFEKEDRFLTYVKPLLKTGQTVIIVNLFCDMMYPNKIYESDIEGLMFINLFLIANKKRFTDILSANNLSINKNKEEYRRHPREWLLHNQALVEKGLLFIASEFGIKYEKLDWKFELDLLHSKTELEKKSDEHIFLTYPLQENKEVYSWVNETKNQRIDQVESLAQLHPNLSGFYSMNNIKEFGHKNNLEIETFIQNYILFNQNIEKKSENIKHLKKPLFEILERYQVPLLINDKEIFNAEVCPLYISQGCIVSDKNALNDLKRSLSNLKRFFLKSLFILVGINNHYFVLRLENMEEEHDNKITLIDSLNTPIQEIMNNICSIENANREDIARISEMNVAIKAVRELYYSSVTVEAMVLRLKVDELIKSFNSFKEKGELEKWLNEEYKIQTLQNELFEEMREVTEKELGGEYISKLTEWFREEFVQQRISKPDIDSHPLKRFRVESI